MPGRSGNAVERRRSSGCAQWLFVGLTRGRAVVHRRVERAPGPTAALYPRPSLATARSRARVRRELLDRVRPIGLNTGGMKAPTFASPIE